LAEATTGDEFAGTTGNCGPACGCGLQDGLLKHDDGDYGERPHDVDMAGPISPEGPVMCVKGAGQMSDQSWLRGSNGRLDEMCYLSLSPSVSLSISISLSLSLSLLIGLGMVGHALEADCGQGVLRGACALI
jgi:hypothetical protein